MLLIVFLVGADASESKELAVGYVSEDVFWMARLSVEICMCICGFGEHFCLESTVACFHQYIKEGNLLV